MSNHISLYRKILEGDFFDENIGVEMHELAAELYPLCRSLTGNGVRKTFEILKKYLVNLKIYEVPTGKSVFDWTIPEEWNIRSASLVHVDSGVNFIDFNSSNLHVVSYSTPVDQIMDLDCFKNNLYSDPTQPDAIPYRTTYYNKAWGICLQDEVLRNLPSGNYHVKIDSEFSRGSMTYGEYIIKGELEDEILLSTYICHPSMANNELSGPVVSLFLAKLIEKFVSRKYTYRIVFAPETIGAINYIHDNFLELKRNVKYAFNLTCVGDDSEFSYMPSKYGNTQCDRVVLAILDEYHAEKYKIHSYLERGSDERQYCSPGLDLPMCSVMRSKYHCYPQYHTSKDNMQFITPNGLLGSLNLYAKILSFLELNNFPIATNYCEPQLGKRGLYGDLGGTIPVNSVKNTLNFLAYADGTNDLIDLSKYCKMNIGECISIMELMHSFELINLSSKPQNAE